MQLEPQIIDEFVRRHRLPDSYRALADRYFLPLAEWLACLDADRPILLGINGAQGTGKSTVAEFLALALAANHDWKVAVLSIDDFYLTRSERNELAATVHPLLETRGVPGTHDTTLLRETLAALETLGAGESLKLPRFDKSIDDRADPSTWPETEGPVDLIILEGWCVGSIAQPDEALLEPVNALEAGEDADVTWRRRVNAALAGPYADVFGGLDALVLLEAPGFDAIWRWRLEQEQKLAARSPAGAPGVMDEAALRRFMQHYERLTRWNLDVLPSRSAIVIALTADHRVAAVDYRPVASSER